LVSMYRLLIVRLPVESETGRFEPEGSKKAVQCPSRREKLSEGGKELTHPTDG